MRYNRWGTTGKMLNIESMREPANHMCSAVQSENDIHVIFSCPHPETPIIPDRHPNETGP